MAAQMSEFKLTLLAGDIFAGDHSILGRDVALHSGDDSCTDFVKACLAQCFQVHEDSCGIVVGRPLQLPRIVLAIETSTSTGENITIQLVSILGPTFAQVGRTQGANQV